MKKKKGPVIALSVLLAVFIMGACLVLGEESRKGSRAAAETESTENLITDDGVVFGEVSAVGKETLTIKLGTLGAEKVGLNLTGGEVAIRTKEETVFECMRIENTDSMEAEKEPVVEEDDFVMEDLSEGDIVSIALDEDGYAKTITLMHSSSAGIDEENG